jgi:hypothetical protein
MFLTLDCSSIFINMILSITKAKLPLLSGKGSSLVKLIVNQIRAGYIEKASPLDFSNSYVSF